MKIGLVLVDGMLSIFKSLGYCLLGCSLVVLTSCETTPTHTPATLDDIVKPLRVDLLWSLSQKTIKSRKKLKAVDGVSPVLVGENLYVSFDKNNIISVNKKTGKKEWATTVSEGNGLTSSFSGEQDRLYLGVSGGMLRAINRHTGELLWQVKLSSEVLSKPTVSEGVVVVRTGDGNVFGLDSGDGQQIWTFSKKVPSLSLHGTGRPVIDGGQVILGFANGSLSVLSLYDGSVVWEKNIANASGRTEIERMVDVDADPVVTREQIFAASYQTRISALSRGTGYLEWVNEVSVFNHMIMDQNSIYVVAEDGSILAISKNDGTTLWKQDALQLRGLTAPAIHQGYIAVGDYEGYVHWLSKDDGHIVARYNIGSAAISNDLLVSGEKLFVQNNHYGLFSLQISDVN